MLLPSQVSSGRKVTLDLPILPTSGLQACFTFYRFYMPLVQLTSLTGTNGTVASFQLLFLLQIFSLFKCPSTIVDSHPPFWWAPRTPRYCLVHHDVALATTLLPVHLGRTPTVSGLMSHSFPFGQIALPWSIFSKAHYGNIPASCHGGIFVYFHSSSSFRLYALLQYVSAVLRY